MKIDGNSVISVLTNYSHCWTSFLKTRKELMICVDVVIIFLLANKDLNAETRNMW